MAPVGILQATMFAQGSTQSVRSSRILCTYGIVQDLESPDSNGASQVGWSCEETGNSPSSSELALEAVHELLLSLLRVQSAHGEPSALKLMQ